jgi:RimJ/RimL family protein N-acetyltransferase
MDVLGMAGDVNLFFNDDEDEFNCEVDIMIAESKYRRQGFAEEAVRLVMAYGSLTTILAKIILNYFLKAISKLNVKRFYCKINESNEPSLKLFRK